MNETFESSLNVVNPWSSDRGLGSVRDALQLAVSAGQLSKGALLEQEDFMSEVQECSSSLRMISALKEIKYTRQQLEKVNLEVQHNLQEYDTKDVTHGDILEEKIACIKELNSHLEEVLTNKQVLISRLQQPFATDYLKLQLPYQRYASELLPHIVPTLSELSDQLVNLEWASRINSTASDLGGLLADVTTTLGTHQTVSQSLVQIRALMEQLSQLETTVDK